MINLLGDFAVYLHGDTRLVLGSFGAAMGRESNELFPTLLLELMNQQCLHLVYLLCTNVLCCVSTTSMVFVKFRVPGPCGRVRCRLLPARAAVAGTDAALQRCFSSPA